MARQDTDMALLERCDRALARVDTYHDRARSAVAALVGRDGGDPASLHRHQHEVHGLAWVATYRAALRALAG